VLKIGAHTYQGQSAGVRRRTGSSRTGILRNVTTILGVSHGAPRTISAGRFLASSLSIVYLFGVE
jgi:hypothetical protein